MKKRISLLFLILTSTISFCQEASNKDNVGENFSLEGALALLKKSNTIDEFEQLLNKEENNVNNLDLNNDGTIDYVTVNDINEGDTHVLVLSTYLNETEKQDIATIGIEKTGFETASLQIEGDTDLYPENAIAEPFDTIQTSKDEKSRPQSPEIVMTNIVVNVWFWPSVRYIYAPRYVPFRSPYRWALYPIWWKPWHPYRYNIFYKRCAPHRIYYRRTPVRTVIIAHRIYAPRRNRSTLIIHNRRTGNTIIRKNNRIPNYKVRNNNNNNNSVRIHGNFRGSKRRR